MGLLSKLRRSEPELRQIEIPEGGLDDAGLRKAGRTVLRAVGRSELIGRELDPLKLGRLQRDRPDLFMKGDLHVGDFLLVYPSPQDAQDHVIDLANEVIAGVLAGQPPGKEYTALQVGVDVFTEQYARPE